MGRITGLRNFKAIRTIADVERRLGRSLVSAFFDEWEKCRDPEVKAKLIALLFPYCFPKLAQIEFKVDSQKDMQQKVTEHMEKLLPLYIDVKPEKKE
jgi:hypothetical protein